MLGLTTDRLALFTLASLVLAATPGPVWLYLISRTLAKDGARDIFRCSAWRRGCRCTRHLPHSG